MLDNSRDVVAVMVVTLVALVLALLGLPHGSVMLLLGVLLAVLLPGYALAAWWAQGVFPLPMRLVLSVGLSVGLTLVVSALLAWSPWGLQTRGWTLVMGSITLGAAAAALRRRTVVFVYASPYPPPLRHPLVVAGGAGFVLALLGVTWISATGRVDAAVALFAPASLPARSASPWVLPDALASVGSGVGAVGPAPSAPPATSTPQPTAVAPDRPSAHPINIALDGWPTRRTDTARHGYTDGQYRVALTGQRSIGVSSRLPADDYRLSVDIALEQGAAGLVFLATEPAGMYRIMFDRERGYAIQRVDSPTDQVAFAVHWTPTSAVQATPLQVRIERRGATLQFFANDEALTTFSVPDGTVTNHVGVALADASGQGQATFTNLVVERVPDAQ